MDRSIGQLKIGLWQAAAAESALTESSNVRQVHMLAGDGHSLASEISASK